MADLDPVRPTHPTWPARPVPEEGDEKRRHPTAPPHPERGEEAEREPETPPHPAPPPDDSTGQNVDEYV
ncbi:MAG TPA: hypothetical protein VLN90_04645 [Thioalkalivibrio sp.]|nr:hypothetical protein [Thioalkalivibrio sp.]